jgi:8-oxo-dGTP diphosphatase
MELFDVYNKGHTKIGRSIYRGTPLADGEYGLVVHVWIKNSDGKYIISKRAKHKTFGGLWECPGGGAITGEISLETAIREVKEEIGITLDPQKGRIIKFCVYEAIHMICDVWLFSQDISTDFFILQAEEVSDIRVVEPEEIMTLNNSGEFVPVYGYLDWLFG